MVVITTIYGARRFVTIFSNLTLKGASRIAGRKSYHS